MSFVTQREATGGNCSVQIDSHAPVKISDYASSPSSYTYHVRNLSDMVHVITVKVLGTSPPGSHGTSCSITRFLVE